MPYGILVPIIGFGLVAWFDFVTAVSWRVKAAVTGLFFFSLAGMYGRGWLSPTQGTYLLIALNITLIFYRLVWQARNRK